jgi:hypothetical protein
VSRGQPGIPLRELAGIGPFFALSTGPTDACSGWRRASSLITDAGVLRAAVDDVAARLGSGRRWIAASLFYQAWAAQLTSVYAGSAALCGAVPDLRADRLFYRPRRSGPVDLAATPLETVSLEAGWRHLHDDHLAPLAEAIRRHVRIGRYLLLGNEASALAGSLTVLASARGESVRDLLGHGWARPAELAMAGRWMSAPDGPRFARTTCCGFELLDADGRCGDCSLNWRRP